MISCCNLSLSHFTSQHTPNRVSSLTTRKLVLPVVAILVTSALLNFPQALTSTKVVGDEKRVYHHVEDKDKTNRQISFVFHWVHHVLDIICCLLLAVFSVIILVFLRRASTMCETVSRSSKAQKRVTIMLLAVVGFSFFTRVISLITAIVAETNPTSADNKKLDIKRLQMTLNFQSFVKIFLLIHSSANIVFYTISREFRQTLMAIFKCGQSQYVTTVPFQNGSAEFIA